MIPELDRYHGIVLRQVLLAIGTPVRIGIANASGRIDAFCIERGAFQIKHSSKRLSPWQFTYMPENLKELRFLQGRFELVWVMLVCGVDGVVALSANELMSIARGDAERSVGVRVSRSRRGMYRISSSGGELQRAKARGVSAFVDALRTLSEAAGGL